MNKPFSQACENNKEPILTVLQQHFSSVMKVLEIGSGTGQHAVYFSEKMPHLQWQTTDLQHNHTGIKLWLDEAGLLNVLPPVALDVNQQDWAFQDIDGVFSANTAHIMPWEAVVEMFRGVGGLLPAGGVFCQYGPFNYQSEFTSDSNRAFDQFLKDKADHMGIRDFEEVQELAFKNGMSLIEDRAMPANNRILVWGKHEG